MKTNSVNDNEHILEALGITWKEAKPELVFNSTFELLVAVILSAQCTDQRVNKVTAELFKEYNTAEKVAGMSIEVLEEYIKSCGLYQNKAKNILATAKMLVEEYGGEIPSEREELMKLPGVGRKTANVVLSVGFHKAAIAVDTHVFRVSNRMGLVDAKTPEETERQLCNVIPEKDWGAAHHWLIFHGRRICHSQKPDCGNCPVAKWCRYLKNKENNA